MNRNVGTVCTQHRLRVEAAARFKRTMYILKPTKIAKRAAGKHVTVHEFEDGAVCIRFEGKELSARAFDEDRRVSQGAIVENKLLGAALEHIRKQQEGHEAARLASAKSKRDKRLVRKKFAGADRARLQVP